MAIGVIPTSVEEEIYSEEVSLDEIQYELRFRWNTRASLWYLDIYELDGTPVQLGVPITNRTFLTRFTRTENSIRGEMYAVETDGVANDAGKNDLGDRVVLYYIPASDLVDLIAENV